MTSTEHMRWTALLLVCAVPAAPAATLQTKDYYPTIAAVVAEGLPEAHVSHKRLGDSMAEKALDNYLNVLDADHSYFLSADIQRFRESAKALDDSLREGHIDVAYEVFDLFKERAADRVKFVEHLLETGFDCSREETYRMKRDELPWPADAEARDDLWRRKVKNEILARKVAEVLDAEEPEESGEDNGDPSAEEEKTPEEMVRTRYRQFVTVLEGHDAEWVLQAYLNGFAQAYDSHSAYLSPRATEDFDIAMKLSLTGIGAVLTYDDGAAKIVRLIAGGPAARDGRLQPGDRIVAVAQGDEEPVDIMYWPLYKSVRLIRGGKGTPVLLRIIPASDLAGTTVKGIRLVRDTIKLEERAAKYTVHSLPSADEKREFKLGVLTLPDFYADQQGRKRGDPESKSCAEDVRRLLTEMKEQRVDGVLLDLRNNGGGSLQEAIEMTGFFIDRGPVVQVKANRRLRQLDDPDRNTVYGGPLVILVNRLSASASEILAGALQDYGRAVIVGDQKTHGKGSVQSVFPVERGNPAMGSLKVTTAAFYRIDGQSTQLHGVTPDIVVSSTMDVMEIGEEFLPNVLPPSWVSPTRYNRYGSLASYLPALREASEKRRAQDERFTLYDDLRHRLGSRLAEEEVPLQWDARLAVARRDRELDRLRNRITELMEATEKIPETTVAAAGEEAKPGEPEPDVEEEEDEEGDSLAALMLDEALMILRDLVDVTGESQDRPGPESLSAGI